MNGEIDEYISSLRKRLIWISRDRRTDILTEIRSHLSERVSAGESPDDAIASFGPASAVAREYLRIYGFGGVSFLLLGIAGVLIAVLTVPAIFEQASDALSVTWESLGFLAVAIVLVVFSSAKGGWRAGVLIGTVECITRFAVLGILMLAGMIVVEDGALGAIGFVLASLLLPLVGYFASSKSEDVPEDS